MACAIETDGRSSPSAKKSSIKLGSFFHRLGCRAITAGRGHDLVLDQIAAHTVPRIESKGRAAKRRHARFVTRPRFTSSNHQVVKSKRSRVITLVHALTKSCTNFCWPSDDAYTSDTARSSEFDPNNRSTGVAVHFTAPVLRSRPS